MLLSCDMFKTFIFSIVIFSIVFDGRAIRRMKLPKNETIPSILVFGDSMVDTGNNNNILSVIKCNFPPYGRDFPGGVPTGRFCNGKVPSDLIAEELGIKELVPAYLDPNLRPDDLLTGVCFASGGAGYDPLTSSLYSVISLEKQLEYLKEYIGKLTGVAGKDRAKEILEKSLYVVSAASNDLANVYYVLPTRRLQFDVPSYTDQMIQGASSFLQEIYKLGARRVAVFSAPPTGCIPSQRTFGGGCAEDRNDAAIVFNQKLYTKLNQLNANLPHAKMVYIDAYTSLLHIIQNPHKYGLEFADKGCCGTGTIETAVLCNRLNPFICQHHSKYVFWDSYHPTENTYRIMVSQILKDALPKLF